MAKRRRAPPKPASTPGPEPAYEPLPWPRLEVVPLPSDAAATQVAIVEAVKHLRVGARRGDESSRDVHMLAADVIYGVLRAFERGDVEALREPMAWARADLSRHNDGPWFGASAEDRVDAQIQLLHDVAATLTRYGAELEAITNSRLARDWRQRHEQPGAAEATVALAAGGRAALEADFAVPDRLEEAPVVTRAALEIALHLQNDAVLPIVPPLPSDMVPRIANVLVKLADDRRLEVRAVTRAILRALGATNPKPDDLFKSERVEAWLTSRAQSQVPRNG
jgi:hypothetical protein